MLPSFVGMKLATANLAVHGLQEVLAMKYHQEEKEQQLNGKAKMECWWESAKGEGVLNSGRYNATLHLWGRLICPETSRCLARAN